MNEPSTVAQSALGQTTAYREGYDPGRLFPIPRAENRASLAGLAAMPMFGVDIWNAYELSWLRPGGVPKIAVAEIHVPADSPRIIESKSLKLYLNGFAHERYASDSDIALVIERDLSAAAGAPVSLRLQEPEALAGRPLQQWVGVCLDQLPISLVPSSEPEPAVLALASRRTLDECLVSHLLRSLCPVTGQPDWASVQIRYRGHAWDHAALLRYLLGFRQHAEFHEHCVERIYHDLWQRLHPERLSVYARYTRRGGIDINPYRSSVAEGAPDNARLVRQ